MPGRRSAAQALPRAGRRRLLPAAMAASLCLVSLVQAQPRALDLAVRNPVPLMAYYYIWFDTGSWDRAKTDFPILGRYSSDSAAVMRQHAVWARQAGIDGFIVSWKSTDKLDRRLEQLMDIAYEESLSLMIIYQGLDYARQPLSIDRIDSDLEHFVKLYADHPVYGLFDKPVIIWSGTSAFSSQEVFSVTSAFRKQLYILASEHNAEGFLRLANWVDGNAYYWGAVNPETYPRYLEKLTEIGDAVHAHHGLWIAPAAPGFDARSLGGETEVERKGGATLRTELDAAQRSSPDVIGLISWNEFSENTHVEPSERYGTEALDVLADRHGTAGPTALDFDSSEPGTTSRVQQRGFYVLGGLVLLVLSSLGFVLMRQRRSGGRALTEKG